MATFQENFINHGTEIRHSHETKVSITFSMKMKDSLKCVLNPSYVKLGPRSICHQEFQEGREHY